MSELDQTRTSGRVRRQADTAAACPFGARRRHARRFAPDFPQRANPLEFLDGNSGAELLIVHRRGGPTPNRQAKSLKSIIRVESLRRADSHPAIEPRDIVSVRFGLPLEEATGTFPSRISVVDHRLTREGKGSPGTKYRSRSALLQERASKLVSGSGELTTRIEPAMIGCEA
jgi:hypothetical protein